MMMMMMMMMMLMLLLLAPIPTSHRQVPSIRSITQVWEWNMAPCQQFHGGQGAIHGGSWGAPVT